MGSCCSSTKNNRVNNKYIPNSELIELKGVDMDLLKVIPSICKIKAKNHTGTGFFINLGVGYNKKFLMTNEHIITRQMIEAKETILVTYNCEKEKLIICLNESERYIQDFLNINIDATIVRILPKDKIDNSLFLKPAPINKKTSELEPIGGGKYVEVNINIIKPYDLINKSIYIPQFPLENNLSFSKGKITQINRFEIKDSYKKFIWT